MSGQTDFPEKFRNSRVQTLSLILNFVRRHGDAFLLVLALVLISLAVFLVNSIATHAFTSFFTCKNLVDGALHTDAIPISLCDDPAIKIKGFEIIPRLPLINVGPFSFPDVSIPFLPKLNVLDGPLETAREVVTWGILLACAVVSLVLTYVVVKIKDFARRLLDPRERKIILTNLSIWLLIFVLLCGLFYSRAGR